mmetsp:Transcript_45281/g.107754  ORF Transcript_45281/g.107754 Transcript_45281/m.107754 type:complete len:210 (-) Transcript_45281:168-797(-)
MLARACAVCHARQVQVHRANRHCCWSGAALVTSLVRHVGAFPQPLPLVSPPRFDSSGDFVLAKVSATCSPLETTLPRFCRDPLTLTFPCACCVRSPHCSLRGFAYGHPWHSAGLRHEQHLIIGFQCHAQKRRPSRFALVDLCPHVDQTIGAHHWHGLDSCRTLIATSPGVGDSHHGGYELVLCRSVNQEILYLRLCLQLRYDPKYTILC